MIPYDEVTLNEISRAVRTPFFVPESFVFVHQRDPCIITKWKSLTIIYEIGPSLVMAVIRYQ